MDSLLKQLAVGIAVSVGAVLVMFARKPPSRSTDVSGLYSVNMQVIAAKVRRQPLPVLDSGQIQDLFLPLQIDAETQQFIDTSVHASKTVRWRVTNAFLTFGRATFGRWSFHGSDELTGALYPGSLFVTSAQNFRTLLGPLLSKDQVKILDLGAGDGTVTITLARACNLQFESFLAVEASIFKRWRLKRAGFTVTADLPLASATFDVLVMLNVLDVTPDPAHLLTQALSVLKSGGFLVLGLVLPYRPRLQRGTKPLAALSQDFNGSHGHMDFEKSFVELLHVLSAYPLILRKWTRVPYLSGGDWQADLHVHNDALLVLEKKTLAGPMPSDIAD